MSAGAITEIIQLELYKTSHSQGLRFKIGASRYMPNTSSEASGCQIPFYYRHRTPANPDNYLSWDPLIFLSDPLQSYWEGGHCPSKRCSS